MPEFRAATASVPAFNFDSTAGRWIVLGLLGTAGPPAIADSAARVMALDLFDDERAALFLTTSDPQDTALGRLADRIPGQRVFLDHDHAVARLLGALPADPGAAPNYRPHWLLIDPALSVRAVVPIDPEGRGTAQLVEMLRQLPPPDRHMGQPVPAPILILPAVFEPAFCAHLIGLFQADGRELSGFMREENGKTVGRHDPSFKVRRDYLIEDQELIRSIQGRILRKVVPQIERVHFFRATRMERYLVGGYPADEGGHFRPHRDNTTAGTAHRRYAVSINLNGDFDGGEVSFPEYGPQGYKAPPGAAVIFSCSLLHAVSRVTRGTRYAFLPFLYDDAAAKLREENAGKLAAASGYRA
jgi:predicted 2-oxoglutarate/Fe(II)-dependent dioxygenase YbiX